MRSCIVAVALSAAAGLVCLLADRPTIAADAPAWGSIKGKVIFPGTEVPAPVALDVTKDKEACLAKGKIFSEEWVVDKKTMGVANVFVWITPTDPAKGKLAVHPKLAAVPDKPAEVDQPCCAFVPHALAMREGQDLLIKNSSTIAHNANLVVDTRVNTGSNVLIPPGGQQAVKDLKQQKLAIKLDCNIHPWMTGKVFVFNHPYFAVTDAEGNFEIKDAPEGPCRLMMYHDAGWVGGADFNKGREITIKAGAVTDLGKYDAKTGKSDAK